MFYLLICTLSVNLSAQAPDSSLHTGTAVELLPEISLTDYVIQMQQLEGIELLLFRADIGNARANITINDGEPTPLSFLDGEAKIPLEVDEGG